MSGTNTLDNLEIGESSCPDAETTGEQDIRTVLEDGFLVHLSDGQLSLISSTNEIALMYSPVA